MMKKYVKAISEGISELSKEISEKNTQAALVSRLRTVLRCERKNIEREYAVLGKLYYDKLHDELLQSSDLEALTTASKLEAHFERFNTAADLLAKLSDTEPEQYFYEPLCIAEEKEEEILPDEEETEDTEAAAYGENDSLLFE